MSKNTRLWGLAILGALLIAGTIVWNHDSDPWATAGKGADVTRGPSTDERGLSFAQPSEGGEVTKNLSIALLGSALTEPPPEFQAVQPLPPRALIAAAKQGLATRKRPSADSAIPVELAVESARIEPNADVAVPGTGAPLEDTGTVPFASSLPEDQGQPQQRVPLELDRSPMVWSRLPLPPFQPNSEESGSMTVPVGQARNDIEKPPAVTPETGSGDVATASEEDDVAEDDFVSGLAVDGSRLFADEVGHPHIPNTHVDAEEIGNGMEPDDQLASRSFDSPTGTTRGGKSKTSDPEKQREAADADAPVAVSPSTVIRTERLLHRLGFDPGPVDGVVGPMTVDAIVLFQKAHGRETTGEISDQLIATLETKLFESFQQYIARSRRQNPDTPKTARIEQAGNTVKVPPSDSRQPAKNIMAHGDRDTLNKTGTTPETLDKPKSGGAAGPPAQRIEKREIPIPIQQVGLQARTERIEEKAANAFEACARSGEHTEYVKTQSGFVLCEEFSFDTGIRR